jgi:hypothetical protein
MINSHPSRYKATKNSQQPYPSELHHLDESTLQSKPNHKSNVIQKLNASPPAESRAYRHHPSLEPICPNLITSARIQPKKIAKHRSTPKNLIAACGSTALPTNLLQIAGRKQNCIAAQPNQNLINMYLRRTRTWEIIQDAADREAERGVSNSHTLRGSGEAPSIRFCRLDNFLEGLGIFGWMRNGGGGGRRGPVGTERCGPSGERRLRPGLRGTERRRDLGRQRVCGLEVGVQFGLRCLLGRGKKVERKQCAVRRGLPLCCVFFLLTVSSPFEVHLLFISSGYLTCGTRARLLTCHWHSTVV